MVRTSNATPDQSESDYDRPQMMKGASALDVRDIPKYDVQMCNESVTKQSKIVERNGCSMISDNDVWVEKVLFQKQTGKARSFFISRKTGRRMPDEPPSGASKILYLKVQPQEVKGKSAKQEERGFFSKVRLCSGHNLPVREYGKPPPTTEFIQNSLPSTVCIPTKRATAIQASKYLE